MNPIATIVFIVSALIFNAGVAKADDLKVGIIDLQYLLEKSDAGKKARAQLLEDFNKKNKEFQTEELSIKKSQEEYMKKKPALSEKAQKEQETKLQEKYVKHMESKQRAQEELKKKEQDMVTPIMRKIREKIPELAKKKGYSLVIDKNESLVFYFQEKDDLTEEVLKSLN